MISEKLDYKELKKLWGKTFPNSELIYSLYDWTHAHFLNDKPLVEGKFILTFNSWYDGGDEITVKGKDLTWKKLVNILDKKNDGSHIFLEDIRVNDNKVNVFLGS